MDTFRKKTFRYSLFAAAFILLQLNVACTGQRTSAASTFTDTNVNIPNNTGNPFGDNFQIDDPFGTGTDITADDFVFTNTDEADDIDLPLFDTDGSGANLTNDCINNDLFANQGFFLDTGTATTDSCMVQSGQAGMYGQQSISPIQLLMSQMSQGTMYGLQCINVAYLYQPIVEQDPELGFVLAMAGITDCYHNIFAQVAGSRYWAQGTAHRMQNFEPEWIVMAQDILNQ